MSKKLFFLFLLLIPLRVEAAATFVKFGTGYGGLATFAVTGTGTGSTALGTVTTGDSILVVVRWNNQVRSLSSVTDTQSNIYTLVSGSQILHGSGTGAMAMAYSLNVTGGTSFAVTGTLDGGSSEVHIGVHVVNGLATSAAFDQVTSDNAETGTAVDTPSITPASSGSYLFASEITIGNFDTTAPNVTNNTWVEQGDINGGGDTGLQMQYFVQTSAASIAAEWTNSSTGNAMCLMAVFKPAAGAASRQSIMLTTGAGE